MLNQTKKDLLQIYHLLKHQLFHPGPIQQHLSITVSVRKINCQETEISKVLINLYKHIRKLTPSGMNLITTSKKSKVVNIR
jgi:hypothetical protein